MHAFKVSSQEDNRISDSFRIQFWSETSYFSIPIYNENDCIRQTSWSTESRNSCHTETAPLWLQVGMSAATTIAVRAALRRRYLGRSHTYFDSSLRIKRKLTRRLILMICYKTGGNLIWSRAVQQGQIKRETVYLCAEVFFFWLVKISSYAVSTHFRVQVLYWIYWTLSSLISMPEPTYTTPHISCGIHQDE